MVHFKARVVDEKKFSEIELVDTNFTIDKGEVYIQFKNGEYIEATGEFGTNDYLEEYGFVLERCEPFI